MRRPLRPRFSRSSTWDKGSCEYATVKNCHGRQERLELTPCHTSGYNPPKFILDAAKSALDRVDCNQYSPTKGRPRLKKAIADAYSPYFGRTLNPETEVTITTGANEGEIKIVGCLADLRTNHVQAC